MARELEMIEMPPGGEVDHLLEEASGAAVELGRDGVHDRLDRTPQPQRWAGDAAWSSGCSGRS